jgi:hypothetical protein
MDMQNSWLLTILTSLITSGGVGAAVHLFLEHGFARQLKEHEAKLTLEAERLKAQLTLELENVKGSIGRDQVLYEKIIDTRLPTYRELWALSGVMAASGKDDMEGSAQLEFADKLRDWYYQDGHGLVLSKEVSTQLLEIRNILRGQSSRKLLSILRTQLKQDLQVYGEKADNERFAS